MTTLDPTSVVGKLRLRVGDYLDLSYLPDSVYISVYENNEQNMQRTAKEIAVYILGMLSHQTHRRLNQIEVWGSENFKQYKEFLILTIKDPAFMSYAPIPYGAEGTDIENAIAQFQSDWNRNFYSGTEAQQLAVNALYSPNDGGAYGFTITEDE